MALFRPALRPSAILLLILLTTGGGCSDSPSRSSSGAISSTQIEASGFVFDALVAGPPDGTPVLLLHGFPESSLEWRAQLAALGAKGYRAVAPDLRGYSPGARPSDVASYRIDLLVSDVIGMADRLGAPTFHLVGHDWGAAIAWVTAVSYPDRLRSLTAVSVPHPAALAFALETDPDQRRMSAYVDFFKQEGVAEETLLANNARTLRALYGSGPAAASADDYVRLLSEPGALTAALDYYRANDFTSGAALPAVKIPTLYVWSTADVALGRVGAEATARFVDAPYRFAVLDGVSHWVPEDAADALTALLLDHLATYN
jgi:pimeloyl-ACP methyl ester carboxylesterase